jgi:Transposase
MEGAGAAPRSPRTLKTALEAVGDLESAGILSPADAAEQRDALKSEGLAYVRSLGSRREPGGEAAAGAPLPAPPPQQADKLQPQSKPQQAAKPQACAVPRQGEQGWVQSAVQRLEKASAPARSAPAVPLGQRSVLSMAGFTRTATHRGDEVQLAPPVLRYRKAFLCCNEVRGCDFSSDFPGPLKMHEKVGCRYALREAAAAPEMVERSSADEEACSESEEAPAVPADGAGRKRAREPEAKQDGRRNNRGAKRRHRYSNVVKADALDLLTETLERGGFVQDAERELGLPPGTLSKWRKTAERIYCHAAEKLRRSLSRAAMHKRAAQARWPAMEAELLKEITRYRARGRHLSIRWLTVKARLLFAKLYPEEEEVFAASRSWRRRFFTRNGLTRLKATNTKSKSVEERLPMARIYHQKLALLVSSPPPNKPDAPMDDVFGRFPLHHRRNLDQVALPFTSVGGRTIDFVGAGRVRSHVQMEGLLKRQGTINLCFSPILMDRTKAGKIGLIFRGMGKVPAAERAAYDPGVYVQFQRKAWMDRPTALQWVDELYKPIAAETGGEQLLFCDNLDAQVHMDFRKAARRCDTLVWYPPPACTDFLQAVDAGAGALIVQLYLDAQDTWLDLDANLEIWEGKMSASMRRILMTQWLGAAWKKFCSSQYDHARLRWFEKTGMAMTSDGSRDFKITPEGTTAYSFVRLDLADAAAEAAAVQEAQVVPEAAPPPPDSDDEEVQLQRAAAIEEEELVIAPPDGFADAADDEEQVLMLFCEMVRLTVQPGEQLRVLAGPPQLNKELVGRQVAVRIIDVGWCAGLVVSQSSGPRVQSYNYKVRFDADDVQELWLREARYVGSSTFSAANNWAELDACGAGSWTLIALSVAPRGVPVAEARGGGGAFRVTPDVRTAARAVPPQPVALGRPAAPPAARRAVPQPAVAPPAPMAALLEPRTAAPAAGTARRMLTCWRAGCGRTFTEGQGDENDKLACGLCEHFANVPSV